jgi:hypothetical protein
MAQGDGSARSPHTSLQQAGAGGLLAGHVWSPGMSTDRVQHDHGSTLSQFGTVSYVPPVFKTKLVVPKQTGCACTDKVNCVTLLHVQGCLCRNTWFLGMCLAPCVCVHIVSLSKVDSNLCSWKHAQHAKTGCLLT